MAEKNLILTIVNNDENYYEGNLRYYFKIIIKAPNNNNPYHNFRHTMHVFCRVYEAGIFEKLSKPKMKALLIGALFHDHDHTDKMGNDPLEIKRALAAVRKYILNEDLHLLPDIDYLITSTEYPHKPEIIPTEMTKILRDADLSQGLADIWLQQIIFGLSSEFSIPAMEHLQNQINFLSNLQFQSNWGRTVFQDKVSKRLAEIQDFLEILE